MTAVAQKISFPKQELSYVNDSSDSDSSQDCSYLAVSTSNPSDQSDQDWFEHLHLDHLALHHVHAT